MSVILSLPLKRVNQYCILKVINVLCNALHVSFKFISYLHLHFHMGLIVHDMYIYNSLLAMLKVFNHFNKFYRFQDFMKATRLDPVLGGLDYTMSQSFCYYGLFLLNVHITVIMTIVFMTTSGIFTV